MTINKKKSGIIFLEDAGNHNNIMKKYKNLKIDNYPILNQYKYLGIIIDNNLNFNFKTQLIIKKIKTNKKILST